MVPPPGIVLIPHPAPPLAPILSFDMWTYQVDHTRQMCADWMSSGADGLESVQACHRVLLTRGFPVPLLVRAVSASLEMAFLI